MYSIRSTYIHMQPYSHTYRNVCNMDVHIRIFDHHRIGNCIDIVVRSKSLDVVFGFESNKKSSMKKLKQFYDEIRDEHVFVIEYRVVKGDSNLQNEGHEFTKYKPGELIREINSRVSG